MPDVLDRCVGLTQKTVKERFDREVENGEKPERAFIIVEDAIDAIAVTYVPVYTAELRGAAYLHHDILAEAFVEAGLEWLEDWEGPAICAYLEAKGREKLDELFEEAKGEDEEAPDDNEETEF